MVYFIVGNDGRELCVGAQYALQDLVTWAMLHDGATLKSGNLELLKASPNGELFNIEE